MLRRLRIENLVLIREAELELACGLNAISGETGAGKTILAQAIGLLLGQKGDSSAVGPAADEAYVEAELELPDGFLDDEELSALAELRPDGEDGLVLARRVFADGRTRAYAWGRAIAREDAAAARRRMESWLKRRAEQIFGMVLKQALSGPAAAHGISAPTWSVRWMKRRWGSCGRDGRVVFNIRLVQTPLPLVEYVVVHELCHLKHHHHGKTFYALLAKCLPDWKERRKALNAIDATPEIGI